MMNLKLVKMRIENKQEIKRSVTMMAAIHLKKRYQNHKRINTKVDIKMKVRVRITNHQIHIKFQSLKG